MTKPIYTDQKRAEQEKQRLADSLAFMNSLPKSRWIK